MIKRSPRQQACTLTWGLFPKFPGDTLTPLRLAWRACLAAPTLRRPGRLELGICKGQHGLGGLRNIMGGPWGGTCFPGLAPKETLLSLCPPTMCSSCSSRLPSSSCFQRRLSAPETLHREVHRQGNRRGVTSPGLHHLPLQSQPLPLLFRAACAC